MTGGGGSSGRGMVAGGVADIGFVGGSAASVS
jgi:hypothetical protein